MLAPLLVSPLAAAQSEFFRVSPGPLSTAHAPWDNSDGCSKCHRLGEGVSGLLCLDCHDHTPLKLAIQRGQGLHARFKEPCVRCHPEHKGRTATVDSWAFIGGRATFDHARTGFPLNGRHLKVPCTACHKRTLKSGRTSFFGLGRGCNDCHKNPHGFTSPKLQAHACEQCHKTAAVAGMRGIDVPFNHAEVTGVPLVGKHGRALCRACHKSGKMTSQGGPRGCKDCHRSPHGPTFAADKPCARCHGANRPWKKAIFDHDTTEFPLRGEHAQAQCGKCHKNPKIKPQKTCVSCHGDTHRGRFEKRPCEGCHRPGDLRRMVFDHDTQTKFALVGLHAQTKCRSCHRGSKPAQFERFPTPDCQACHRHQDAHQGQLKDKPCAACHGKGGSTKDLLFDHQKDARFSLTGLHLKLAENRQCKKCHPNKLYRTNKLRCVDCHKDTKHKGALGDQCERCHTSDVKFAKTPFDHNTKSRFKLEGKHAKVKCDKCHPEAEPNYKRADIRCVVCHAKTEPHGKRLGDDCGRCHTPDAGAPKFDHDTMTGFPRQGMHRETACQFCHRKLEPGAKPPPVGWTQGLAPEGKVDRLFPVMGKRCSECHQDRHEGRYGTACDGCHRPTSFKDVSRTLHDTGAFRLEGAHDNIPCDRCHGNNRPLTGTGDLCVTCHLEDDRHFGTLGPLCGDCHGQIEWLPSTFNHAQTGFPLRGAHKLAACRGCHGLGTYVGIPTDCEVCHLIDASRVRDPIHGSELTDCKECHREAGFLPARFKHDTYVLRGAHATLWCRDCHMAGTYAGTPRECVGCHLGDYLDSSTTPNHTLLGYSTNCEECHSQTTWVPAHAPGP